MHIKIMAIRLIRELLDSVGTAAQSFKLIVLASTKVQRCGTSYREKAH